MADAIINIPKDLDFRISNGCVQMDLPAVGEMVDKYDWCQNFLKILKKHTFQKCEAFITAKYLI